MFEYHILRAALGLMQIGIVWILLKRDIGYLWRFGFAMTAGAVMHLVPSHPTDAAWQTYIQVPAFLLLFVLTAEASFELFAFLRRRTFIEERCALVAWAAIVGFIPVWICWWWPGDNWYQTVMLIRQYALMWLTGAYFAAWFWLRAMRPIHMELQITDHGEFWGLWLLVACAHASTTKWGVLWRFAQWEGGEHLWRVTGDALMLIQLCICCGFAVNLWRWRPDDEAVAPAESADLPGQPQFRPRRLLHL